MVKLRTRFSVISALFASAMIAGTAHAAEMKRGGILTIGNPAEPLPLVLFVLTDAGSIFNVMQICETVVLADEPGTGFELGPAENCSTSANWLTHVFKIREAVRFSDSRSLDGVVLSLEKAMAPSGAFSFAFQPVKSFMPEDATHIKMELKTSYPSMQGGWWSSK